MHADGALYFSAAAKQAAKRKLQFERIVVASGDAVQHLERRIQAAVQQVIQPQLVIARPGRTFVPPRLAT